MTHVDDNLLAVICDALRDGKITKDQFVKTIHVLYNQPTD